MAQDDFDWFARDFWALEPNPCCRRKCRRGPWAYTSERDVYSFGLGSVHRKADGNTVVTFSTAGQMDEVDENGELVWRLEASLGTGLGYTTWLETLYPSEEELYAR